MTNHTWSYDVLKSIIISKEVSPELLDELKLYFADEINSKRRLYCIHSLEDLVDCLDCLDVCNESDIEALKDIAQVLNDPAVLEAVSFYKRVTPTHENEYAIVRILEENEERMALTSEKETYCKHVEQELPPKPKEENLGYVETYFSRKRSAVHNLIASEIGRKWRELGRELGLQEGAMDDLESDYPRDSRTRTIKMIDAFENDDRRDKRKVVSDLCEALINCRRRDLSIDVMKIITSDR